MSDWSQLRKWDNYDKQPHWIVRFASYAALVVTSAFLIGVLFVGFELYLATGSETRSVRDNARERLLDTPKESFNNRFKIGAAVGATAAIGFLVYYPVKHGRTHLDDHQRDG